MSTPAAITRILDWQRKHEGEVPYSEAASTRLDWDGAHLKSATDCSGMAIRMFMHFGDAATRAELKGCTYTGNLTDVGHLVTTVKSHAAEGRHMLPGDTILFRWPGSSTWSHIAIYAGDGRIWNHGGPGDGPLNWSLADNVNYADEVMVRRWIKPTAPSPQPHPSPTVNGKKLRREWPAYMRPGDFFGLASGGNHSRGGANREERPDVLAIKHRLHELGYDGMSLDSHIFGHGAHAAVAQWQRAHYASSTSDYGQVWHDDWRRLFTY